MMLNPSPVGVFLDIAIVRGSSAYRSMLPTVAYGGRRVARRSSLDFAPRSAGPTLIGLDLPELSMPASAWRCTSQVSGKLEDDRVRFVSPGIVASAAASGPRWCAIPMVACCCWKTPTMANDSAIAIAASMPVSPKWRMLPWP
jgi:hypothetical protein